jgi:hypothetical protein
MVRRTLQEPLSPAREWAGSDVEDDPAALLAQSAARWDRAVLFGESKDRGAWITLR